MISVILSVQSVQACCFFTYPIVRYHTAVWLNQSILYSTQQIGQSVCRVPVNGLRNRNLQSVWIDIGMKYSAVIIDLGSLQQVILDKDGDQKINTCIKANRRTSPDLNSNKKIFDAYIRIDLEKAIIVRKAEIMLTKLLMYTTEFYIRDFLYYQFLPTLQSSNFYHQFFLRNLLLLEFSRYQLYLLLPMPPNNFLPKLHHKNINIKKGGKFRQYPINQFILTYTYIITNQTNEQEVIQIHTYKHIKIECGQMMNSSQMMMSMTNKTDGKLGYTTTVKQQVDQIQNTIQHFKKTLDGQRKQQNQLDFQLKKLEEQTKTNFTELNKEISDKVNYLSELFKADTKNQNKQFEYLQLQNSTLTGEHDKLGQLTNMIGARTQDIQNAVGF